MENSRPRLLRITTVPVSLKILLRGQLRYFKEHGFDVLAVSADGPEVKSIRDEGITHQVVAMTRKITPLTDLRALFRLIRVVRKFRPHVIHSHTPKAGLLGMLAGWLCNVPVRLHTVAGLPVLEARGIKRRVLLITERITLSCATGVLFNSAGLLTSLSKLISSNAKWKVLGKGSSNGIDVEYFRRTEGVHQKANALRNELSIQAGELVLCFVGRLVRDKGIAELVWAFDKLNESFPARLLLVGPFESDLDPLPRETLDSIHTNKRITCLGYQEDVRPAMAASDIFVFPSYREGFPNVVLQACCLSLPCIVSDINGCNEIIAHDNNGLLVPAKNREALLSAMLRLADDQESRASMGANARRSVGEHFHQAYIWRLLHDEYNSRLAGLSGR